MGFWDNYVNLCTERKKTPNGVAKELGIASGTVTAWKQGKIPHDQRKKVIADYFGVTVEELLAEKEKAPGIAEGLNATPAQRELIDKVLKMNESQLVLLNKLLDAVEQAGK